MQTTSLNSNPSQTSNLLITIILSDVK
jgi:hypothetical protein